MIFKREESFFYVCALCGISKKDNKEILLGTGSFIEKDNKFYILTASHVISSNTPVTHIKLSDVNKKCVSLSLTQLNKNQKWLSHPIADMCVFEIDSSNNDWIKTRSFPYNQCSLNMNGFNRDIELTTVGFPCGLGASSHFSPLTFRSFPSIEVISLMRFDLPIVSDFFLLEDPSIGGYSGGPVFDLGYKVDGLITQTKEETILYGIMHGFIGNGTTGGEMAAVTPISYLKDLI